MWDAEYDNLLPAAAAAVQLGDCFVSNVSEHVYEWFLCLRCAAAAAAAVMRCGPVWAVPRLR
jgi:hypothetical protein